MSKETYDTQSISFFFFIYLNSQHYSMGIKKIIAKFKTQLKREKNGENNNKSKKEWLNKYADKRNVLSVF